MANDSLQTVYQYSLTLNNMITVSLMRDLESKFNKFFFWLNVVPGSKTDEGNKTFNFKDGLTFKLSPIKIAELGHALNAYSKGQQAMVGKFALYVDGTRSAVGSGTKKMLFMNYVREEGKEPIIMMTAKQDGADKGISVVLPIPTALAFADVCQKIFERCLELEMSEYKPYSRSDNGSRGTPKRSYDYNKTESKPSESVSFNEDPF